MKKYYLSGLEAMILKLQGSFKNARRLSNMDCIILDKRQFRRLERTRNSPSRSGIDRATNKYWNSQQINKNNVGETLDTK